MATHNGSNGRLPDGRFAKGNPGGPGNPHAAQTARIRAAMLAAITPEDVQAIVRALIERARAGDVHAAREVFDRCVGKATPQPDSEQGEHGLRVIIMRDDEAPD